MLSNSRKGIFLGFVENATKNIYWYDVSSNKVKIASHFRFDDGMNELPTAEIPPNVAHLQRVQKGESIPMDSFDTTSEEFDFLVSPFVTTTTLDIPVYCHHPTFGITLADDDVNGRVHVTDVLAGTSIANIYSTLRAARNAIRGAYVVAINDHPVFDQQ